MEISVNGKIITEREIAREMQYHPARNFEDARRKAAEALTIRELLVQEARRLDIETVKGSDEALIGALIEREVKTPYADEETCRRYYQSHLGRFRTPDLVEARHILFVADPDDPEALASARAKAENAIAALQKRPDRFAELARDLSACSSAKQGGSLGQVTRGSTVSEIETFLFQLDPGQLCPVPIRSRYGFHVLEVQQRVEGKTLPFEAVREKIAEYLEERVWRRAVHQYIRLLIGQFQITGIELKGASSPLVQ
jgi:peptidyl-prolyl cis-trans isomerase C